MIYDFEHSCLKVFVSQLKICLETQKYHPDIIDDYFKLLEHLKLSIAEIMNVYIPHATKPTLYVICPHCKNDGLLHIEFNHTAPVLCCAVGDRPRDVPRSHYIPCGIDINNIYRERGG